MTTDRPYRKRLSLDEACRRLREGAGSQFDPSVVDVFLSLPYEAPVPVERATTSGSLRSINPSNWARRARSPASDGPS